MFTRAGYAGAMHRSLPTLLLFLCLSASAVVAAAPVVPATASREIAGLIELLGRSGCRFERNGSWHDAMQARAHLQRKYDWLRRRGKAGTAEQFIARAASHSSVTGRAYHVQCPGKPTVEAGTWFRALLAALRTPPTPR